MNGYYERDDIRKGNAQYFMKWFVFRDNLVIKKQIFILLRYLFLLIGKYFI